MDLNGFVYYEQKKTKYKSVPSITIYTNSGVQFNKCTYEVLQEPKYVTIQYHRAKKLLFIKAAYEGCDAAIPIYLNKRDAISMFRKDIINIIFDEITNWSKNNHAYKVYGKYDPNLDGVIFDLNVSEVFDKRAINKKWTITQNAWFRPASATI